MEALSAHGFCVPHYERISTLEDAGRFDRFPAVLCALAGTKGHGKSVYLASLLLELFDVLAQHRDGVVVSALNAGALTQVFGLKDET